MADLSGGIERLPPAERLKRLRQLEEEKRKTLEEELSRKKRELEEAEQRTKEEIEETEALQEETLEEMEEEQLEERIEAFRKGKGFVPEEKEEEGPTYASSRQAPGFGQQRSLYDSEFFQRAEEGIDYLLHGRSISPEREAATGRQVYENARLMRERIANGEIEEGYAANRLYEEIKQIKERGGDQFGYLQRTANVLTDIINYRQQDDDRRKAA